MTAMKKPQCVRVTAKDIREGECGDQFCCAVAAALQRATGDSHAHVIEKEYGLYLVVWYEYLPMPEEASQFVRDFDGGVPVKPFSFLLPTEGQYECYGCEELFDKDDLDDEGYCQECRE